MHIWGDGGIDVRAGKISDRNEYAISAFTTAVAP